MSDSQSVQDQVVARVRDWLERSAKRLRHDGIDYAELKLTMREPGWDDDGTAMVTVMLEETATAADIDGRVEGVRSGEKRDYDPGGEQANERQLRDLASNRGGA